VVDAVGLTLVEPLADADVNVPGVIATLVAPVVTQLSVLLAPELIAVGLAENELTPGAVPLLEDEAVAPHSTSPIEATTMSIRAQT